MTPPPNNLETSNQKPLATVALFTYNQERYVREAVQSVLSQNYSPIEIIISDDCSKDRTYEIIEEIVKIYDGPHKVSLSRNSKNIGIPGQINKINALANGELIIAAAGDDISEPHRTERLINAYIASNKRANYLYSLVKRIGIEGEVLGIASSPGVGNAKSIIRSAISSYPVAIGASQAWTKSLVNSFPPISSRVWAEDKILGFRGILIGPIVGIDEPLVQYRVGSGISTTGPHSPSKFLRLLLSDMFVYQQRFIDALGTGGGETLDRWNYFFCIFNIIAEHPNKSTDLHASTNFPTVAKKRQNSAR